MNFIAIDFETANGRRNSACSIGIAVVENGEIVHTEGRFIKPPDPYFAPINISVHGITPHDVINSPTMAELWNSWLCDIVSNQILVAHNASFDRSVLKNSLEQYDIMLPDLDFFCTYKMAKHSLKLNNHKLSTVCKYFNIRLNHHQAESDAIGCAKIALEFCKQAGSISPLALTPIPSTPKQQAQKIDVAINKANSDLSFDGMRFVFTGQMNIIRQEAVDFIKHCGGAVTSSVSKKTDYLVVGDNLLEAYKRNGHTTGKLKTAVELKKQGFDIKIMGGSFFCRLTGLQNSSKEL